jgi:hypothetical protein
MEPDVVVQNFIFQVCQLYDRHNPQLGKLHKLLFNSETPLEERNKYNDLYSEQFWNAVRIWRLEHKKLCENFGFKMTEHNFSETSYQSPLLYNEQKVIKVENISPTKVKVFTEHLKGQMGQMPPLVFYLELKEGNWKGTKLRMVDIDNKEFSPGDW